MYANIFPQKSTDFIVGKDDFSSLEIREGEPGSSFFYFYDTGEHRLIKDFILETSKTGIRTYCNVVFIEKNGQYSPRLTLSKRKDGKIAKEPIDPDSMRKKISSRVEIDSCHQEFWSLIDYIQSLKQVEVPRSGWSVVSSEKKQLLDSLALNRDFVLKVLHTFPTLEAQELLIQAKKDDINNLYASVKQAKNKQSLAEIKKLIDGGAKELELEKWIKGNEWVFGIEYIRRLDATRIGLHSDADILMESLDGFADLIELKRASVSPLFIYDEDHKCYYPSSDLSQVIGQTIHYLERMEVAKDILKSEDDVDVLKPRAKIVIGRSSLMNPKEKQALRKLNDSLHNIEILTYDEIRSRAERIVEHYDGPHSYEESPSNKK